MKEVIRNKSGLSAIVITLILILLSLVAIGIVWVVISRIISDASSDVGLEAFTLSLDITNAYEYNGNIVANLKRNVGEGEITKLTFLLYKDEETESHTVESSINQLESKKFTIPVSQFNSTDIDKIAVAPLYLSSGEEKQGDILDSFTITKSYTGLTPPDGGDEGTGGGEDCTANCTGKVCGSDGCGGSCGTCQSGFSCSSGLCISDTCTPDSNETTCGTSNCGTKLNNCGQIVSCGVCSLGQICSDGICSEITPINSGTVEDLWPGDSGMYFGSSSLSTETSYVGYYAKFPGSAETSCLLIVLHRFPTEGYDKSHIGFSFSTALAVNDNYEIYPTIDGCSA